MPLSGGRIAHCDPRAQEGQDGIWQSCGIPDVAESKRLWKWLCWQVVSLRGIEI